MATPPVSDACSPCSTEQCDAARFPRLERLRAERSSQRRRRVVLALTFVAVLGVAVLLEMTPARDVSSAPAGKTQARAPAQAAPHAGAEALVEHEASPRDNREARATRSRTAQEPEGDDFTAVIDWLLKHRERSTRSTPVGRKEVP